MAKRVATVGVYGFDLEAFLAALRGARELQYLEDARLGVGKRSRSELAPEYRERYLREILAAVELEPIVERLPAHPAAALLCVERDPEACHRSLIAERLAAEHGITVTHLRPDGFGSSSRST